MNATLNSENFVIGDWLVKPTSNSLTNNDVERRVEPKVMALLVYLANSDGKVLSRDLLLDNVWQQVVLGDALTNTIAQLRKALGDSTSPKKYIETIPKQGYRLIPNVQWQADEPELNSYASAPPADLSVGSPPQTLESRSGQERHSPDRARSDKSFLKNLVLLAAVLLAVFLIFKFDLLPERSAYNVPLDDKTRTVAVLPFDVYSDQEEIRHFASGLTEELIHQLATDPNLRVISRTSSSKFQGTDTGIKEISEILNARYIIEGSIRQIGDNLRTTVQLIDANEGFHLWSKTFDNKADDLFLDTQIAIGEKVSLLITNKKVGADNHAKRIHPRSAEAYKSFILAQSHMKIGSVTSYEKAIDYYQKSINISPDYALAYTGIAAAKLLLSQYKHTSARQARVEASELLDKAFSVEPQLAEAFAVRGLLNTYAREYELAEQDYLKAIQLNPGLRFARHNYAYMLSLLFRPKDALIQDRISLELDPLSTRTNFGIGEALIEVGEIEAGIEQFQSCQEVIPHYSGCYLGLATVYGLLADNKKYLHFLQEAEKRSDSNTFWQLSTRAKYELMFGDLEESRTLLEKASVKNKFSYHVLKTDLYLHLVSDELESFRQKLILLSVGYPNASEANFLLGQAAYFLSDCKLSVIQYEAAGKEKPQAFLSIWDWSEGISHQLNLAYCYQQSNNADSALKLIQEYKYFVDQLPISNLVIPGKVYSLARYYVLKKRPGKARAELEKIRDWSLIWLAQKDPVLKTLF